MRSRWLLAASLGLAACAPVPGLAPIGAPEPPSSEGPRYRLFAASELAVRAIAVDSTAPGFAAARLADGDLSTQWSNGGYLNPTSWVVLELEASAALTSIALKTPPSKPGSRYDVQVSEDGQSWTTALAAQTSTSWGTETKTLPAGTQGRFVRLFWRNGGSEPHFSVFEAVVHGQVSGVPAPPPTAMPTATPAPPQGTGAPTPLRRVSLPGQAVASSGSGSLAVDGDPLSVWSTWGALPQWLAVPLEAPASGP
ncbi:MAG: discoidin domain-containing protein, partial [Candidatus Sericytochromatia bacterium]